MHTEKEQTLKKWCKNKVRLSFQKPKLYFKEREIWWVYLGENLGYEQNGGKNFTRPVLVIRKYNLNLALVLPLTTSTKKNPYYFPVGSVDGKEAQTILSQARTIDIQRFQDKIGTLNQQRFDALIKEFELKNFPPSNK